MDGSIRSCTVRETTSDERPSYDGYPDRYETRKGVMSEMGARRSRWCGSTWTMTTTTYATATLVFLSLLFPCYDDRSQLGTILLGMYAR